MANLGYLQLTRNCYQKCQFCSNPPSGVHLNEEEMRANIDRLVDMGYDGVILTGEFTPESALLRMGHIEVDPATGGPVVDQYGRCSDPVYFAAGNLLRPVETAGWSWREGRAVAAVLAADLDGGLLQRRRELLPVHPAAARAAFSRARLEHHHRRHRH